MSTILKLTLGTGETQEVPFDATSIVTVRTRVQRDPGQTPVDEDHAFTNVASFEIVDESGAPANVAPTSDPAFASPGAAIETASSLAIADAAAHIEKALTRFPGDEDLLAVQAELDAQIRGTSTNSWPPAQPAPVEEPAPAVEPTVEPTVDPATLETPQAAIDHAIGLDVTDAVAHITAALAKFPGDEDLLAAQTELDQIIASSANQTPPAA